MHGNRRPHVGPMVMRCTWVGGGADPVVAQSAGDFWGAAPVYGGSAGVAYVPLSLPVGMMAIPMVSTLTMGNIAAAYYDAALGIVVQTSEADDPFVGNACPFLLVVHVLPELM